MARERVYQTPAERQRAFRERRKSELAELRTTSKPRRPRHPLDVYETPPEFAAAGLQLVTTEPATVLDIGAGGGVWGEAARVRWPGAHIV